MQLQDQTFVILHLPLRQGTNLNKTFTSITHVLDFKDNSYTCYIQVCTSFIQFIPVVKFHKRLTFGNKEAIDCSTAQAPFGLDE